MSIIFCRSPSSDVCSSRSWCYFPSTERDNRKGEHTMSTHQLHICAHSPSLNPLHILNSRAHTLTCAHTHTYTYTLYVCNPHRSFSPLPPFPPSPSLSLAIGSNHTEESGRAYSGRGTWRRRREEGGRRRCDVSACTIHPWLLLNCITRVL